jgi:hypothetical protein
MGRYEMVRPTLSKRIIQRIFGKNFTPKLQELQLGKKFKLAVANLVAISFVAGYAMVTVIDPYGGALNSAYAYNSTYSNTGDGDQIYGFTAQQKISFKRGGWSIVTGDEAAAIYVANAADPENGSIKAFAFELVSSLSWGRDQYSCLVALWERESNWRWDAVNRSSGAYGIPQSLPGRKMAEMGADWLTNPETQVRWGVNYIKNRYGAPCGAMAHSNKYNWY